MRLRHVLLLASALGAIGALLLAGGMHRRLREAESVLSASAPAAKDAPPPVLLSRPAAAADPLLNLLTVHTIGLLSLAFLFLAIFLLLLAAQREEVLAQKRAEEARRAAAVEAAVTPLADVAAQAAPEETSEETPPPAQESAAPADTTKPEGTA
jgi:hypothetical protein